MRLLLVRLPPVQKPRLGPRTRVMCDFCCQCKYALWKRWNTSVRDVTVVAVDVATTLGSCQKVDIYHVFLCRGSLQRRGLNFVPVFSRFTLSNA